jgi:hypothetical protein
MTISEIIENGKSVLIRWKRFNKIHKFTFKNGESSEYRQDGDKLIPLMVSSRIIR